LLRFDFDAAVAELGRDPESKATWAGMAERWARLAERYGTEPTTTPKPVSRRRRDPIQRQRAA
jgi:hypothetical protein